MLFKKQKHSKKQGDGSLIIPTKKQRDSSPAEKKQENRPLRENRPPSQKLVNRLEDNVKLVQNIFNNDDTLMARYFENQLHSQVKCCILFIDGMVNNGIVNENVIQPIVQNEMLKDSNDVFDSLQNHVLISNQVVKTADVDELSLGIVNGDTVLFLDGTPSGLIISTKEWETRPVTEPEAERINRGPREGFNESILMNLSMIRRKISTPDLKFKILTMGKQTHTKVCVCYIHGIVNQKILDEVYRRLGNVKLDSILDTGYITEFIRDSPLSPFKTVGNTERPDTVAEKLLDGRIAILVDGSPVALTIPFIFVEYFQINEDYYLDFYYASVGRLLRTLGFLLTISVPSLYLALVTFHQETIPTPLLLSISAARYGIPFPTIVEIIIMLFIFEMLIETGVRMPINIGQALSIVGALVLGTASVEAKFVSAPIVIIVSITAITGMSLPEAKGPTIVLRISLLLLSAFIGLYGYIFGLMALLIHLCEMRSFGVPYMLQFINLDPAELKDTAIREPWWQMKLRTKFISKNRVRQANKDRKL